MRSVTVIINKRIYDDDAATWLYNYVYNFANFLKAKTLNNAAEKAPTGFIPTGFAGRVERKTLQQSCPPAMFTEGEDGCRTDRWTTASCLHAVSQAIIDKQSKHLPRHEPISQSSCNCFYIYFLHDSIIK